MIAATILSMAFEAPRVARPVVTHGRHPVVTAKGPDALFQGMLSKLQGNMPWETTAASEDEVVEALPAMAKEEVERFEEEDGMCEIKREAQNDAMLAAAALTGVVALGADITAIDLATHAELAMAAAAAAGYGAMEDQGPVGSTLRFVGNVTKDALGAAVEANEKYELALKARAVLELGLERVATEIRKASRDVIERTQAAELAEAATLSTGAADVTPIYQYTRAKSAAPPTPPLATAPATALATPRVTSFGKPSVYRKPSTWGRGVEPPAQEAASAASQQLVPTLAQPEPTLDHTPARQRRTRAAAAAAALLGAVLVVKRRLLLF